MSYAQSTAETIKHQQRERDRRKLEMFGELLARFKFLVEGEWCSGTPGIRNHECKCDSCSDRRLLARAKELS